MAKKKKISTNVTNINQCQFGGTVTLNSAQTGNITNSVFDNSLLISPPKIKDYDESGCFRKGSHQMYKAINVSCPCTEEIPFVVSSAKNKQEVRIYYDDVVCFDGKGDLTISLRDAMDLISQQQEAIKKLEKEVKSLKRKSKK